MWIITAVAENEITRVDQHAGLIFQELGTVVQYKNTWRIIYHLPMSDIRGNIASLMRKARGLDAIKNSVDEGKKSEQVEEMSPIFEMMIRDIHELTVMLCENGQLLFPEKRRAKSSLLPMGGSIIEFLFGNIDGTTFNELRRQFSNMKEKQGNLIDIMVNQTIMSSNMALLVKDSTQK